MKRGVWPPGIAAIGLVAVAPVDSQEPDPRQEVVVTARKVEEGVQTIPMSVQALSGEYLDESRLTRLYDLQFAIPGLVVNTAGFSGSGFSLRGMAEQRVSGLSVAPYFNGVYLGSSNLIARMFDLERVEVIKGPQGTLYGRNSTGGSMNYITRAPEDSFSAELEGSWGRFDTMRARGHLNLPLSETVAARVAFIAAEGDGYIRNTADNRAFGEEDYWGVRGSLRFEPTDALTIDFMAQHVRDDGGSSELWTPNPTALADPRDIHLTTVTQPDPFLVSTVDYVDVDLRYDTGSMALRSITGFARSEVNNLDDCAGLPVLRGCVRTVLPRKYEQWSQELQLSFQGNERVDGIIGAYYADEFNDQHFWQFLPLLNSRPLADSYFHGESYNAALFGQASVHFGTGWSATGGVRVSREKSEDSFFGYGVQDTRDRRYVPLSGKQTTWRLDLQRALTDDVRFYAGVSTGYKSGGYTTTQTRLGADVYGPEYVIAYELGAKTQWLDRRLTLNAAAFLNDYEDMQVSSTSVRNGMVVVQVDNAARAEIYGIDAEFSFHASDGLTISAATVWLPKREFVSYEGGAAGFTLSGNKLVRSPEWSASGSIDYRHGLGTAGELSARVEYNYRSGYFYTAENEPVYAQDAFGLLNLTLRFESANDRWYAFAAGRNLTDATYFNQVFLQSSPGYPATFEIGGGHRF
jgi:iron complex outermembrane receptor protein